MRNVIILAVLAVMTASCSEHDWVKVTAEKQPSGGFAINEGLTIYPLKKITIPCKGDKNPKQVRVKMYIIDAQELGPVQVRAAKCTEYLVKSKVQIRVEDYDGSRKDTTFILERKELLSYPYIKRGKSDFIRELAQEEYGWHDADLARKETLRYHLMFKHERPVK
jgi:hypothetical protein